MRRSGASTESSVPLDWVVVRALLCLSLVVDLVKEEWWWFRGKRWGGEVEEGFGEVRERDCEG